MVFVTVSDDWRCSTTVVVLVRIDRFRPRTERVERSVGSKALVLTNQSITTLSGCQNDRHSARYTVLCKLTNKRSRTPSCSNRTTKLVQSVRWSSSSCDLPRLYRSTHISDTTRDPDHLPVATDSCICPGTTSCVPVMEVRDVDAYARR